MRFRAGYATCSTDVERPTLSSVATWDDVRRIALALPDTDERSSGDWRVHGKGFVWERPLRKGDLAALGAKAPKGPILGIRVEHEGIKEALLASDPGVYFTTPHFNGYPALLVRLEEISVEDLEDVIVDAWLVQAPKRTLKAYLATHGDRR
jgi:hypothetical protein